MQYGGSTFDHGSYLVPRGTADIFFPTGEQDRAPGSLHVTSALPPPAASCLAAARCAAPPPNPRRTPPAHPAADFALLCQLYRQAAEKAQHGGDSSNGRAATAAAGGPRVAAEHMGTADFMVRYSPDLGATRTASGYNPLLEDYSNSAFFVGSCLWQRAFFVGCSR